MKRLNLIILLLLVCLPLAAQQMSVTEFTRLMGGNVLKDNSVALLDLLTDEKGFTFLAEGTTPVESQQWVGYVRLGVPPKTRRILIRHPEYGQYLLQVPRGHTMCRRKHFQAVLYTANPTKNYKATHQWVVFHLNPENVLLQVDSTTSAVRQSVVEYYLKVGPHSYKAQAPFYDPQEDKFILTDSVRKDITVDLQPFYSYLTVKTDCERGCLYVDNLPIRKGMATSYRLSEGNHRVNYFIGNLCVYDTLLYMGPAQKKVLELKATRLYARDVRQNEAQSLGSTLSPDAPVKLSVQDTLADIWVDREYVGTARWEGRLAKGYHLVQSVKDGKEAVNTSLVIRDDFPIELVLPATGMGYGLLNIHGNVIGASIRIDGQEYGETPQIVRVEASRSYEVRLDKAGYQSGKCRVRPKGNGQVDVYVQLKKK